ncbi:MAG: DoxX family protein [Cyclobacteriaceae bacterium]
MLLIRLAGGLMLLHGIPKLMGFTERMDKFSDPLGIGSPASLALCVFAEFFCTVFVVLGAFTRIMVIPIIITMVVAVFIVHGGDPIKERELGIFFLLTFTSIFFAGPGKYSLDGLRNG